MTRPLDDRMIAARLRELRTERGWSARELSERCADLGRPIARDVLSKIETNARRARVDEVAVLAAAFGLTLDEFGSSNAITVLHLSDLEFSTDGLLGLPDGRPDAHDRFLRSLCTDLDTTLAVHDIDKPDLVVISGDLSASGRVREFDLIRKFLDGLAEHLGIGYDRIAVVPGNHDVNLDACQSYLHECAADDIEPQKPYWANWTRFSQLFDAWPDDDAFTYMQAEQPWSLYEIKDLRVVIAGLNSTVYDSVDEQRAGWIGSAQAEWFGQRLDDFQRGLAAYRRGASPPTRRGSRPSRESA